MPKIPLTPLHDVLHRLAGEWRGEELIAPSPWDPAGGIAQAVVRNRVALDGLVVIQDHEQSREGVVGFTGHGVFSVQGNEIVLDWWDNWSPSPRKFRGGAEGERMTLVSREEKGMARSTWHFKVGSYEYRLEVSQDGAAWYQYMEATYQRA